MIDNGQEMQVQYLLKNTVDLNEYSVVTCARKAYSSIRPSLPEVLAAAVRVSPPARPPVELIVASVIVVVIVIILSSVESAVPLALLGISPAGSARRLGWNTWGQTNQIVRFYLENLPLSLWHVALVVRLAARAPEPRVCQPLQRRVHFLASLSEHLFIIYQLT